MVLKKSRNYSKMAKKAIRVRSPKKAVKKAVAKAKYNNIASIVKKVVHKEQETKMCPLLTIADAVNIPGAGLSSGGLGVLSQIVPVVAQGNTQTTRIGNKIRPVRLKVRYTLNALPTTVAGGINAFRGLPFFVKVIVYRHRYNRGDSSPDALMETGTGSATLGSAVDTYFRPYNKQEYEIAYSAIHKMTAARHLDTTFGLIEPNSQDSKITSFIVRNFNCKLPKTILFNDSNTQPTNLNWYIGFAVCNVDGSAIAGSSTRATVNCESYLYFQDD